MQTPVRGPGSECKTRGTETGVVGDGAESRVCTNEEVLGRQEKSE
jgi:hypothetical protein